MLKEMKQQLAQWLRHNKTQTHNNLIEYMQERICFYAGSNDTPAEQVKGMNRLLKDIIRLDEEMFGG
jgi:hypothetical protein